MTPICTKKVAFRITPGQLKIIIYWRAIHVEH